MNLFFSALSIGYIAGIFLFADSAVVSEVAAFNPYSVLHIPLYGILTLLLILSFSRFRLKLINRGNRINQRNTINATNPTNRMNSINPTNHINPMNYWIAGIIALVVAIADEIHQAYIPTRNASITDVILDFIGIILCMFFIKRVEQISWFLKKIDFVRRATTAKSWKNGERVLVIT